MQARKCLRAVERALERAKKTLRIRAVGCVATPKRAFRVVGGTTPSEATSHTLVSKIAQRQKSPTDARRTR